MTKQLIVEKFSDYQVTRHAGMTVHRLVCPRCGDTTRVPGDGVRAQYLPALCHSCTKQRLIND